MISAEDVDALARSVRVMIEPGDSAWVTGWADRIAGRPRQTPDTSYLLGWAAGGKELLRQELIHKGQL